MQNMPSASSRITGSRGNESGRGGGEERSATASYLYMVCLTAHSMRGRTGALKIIMPCVDGYRRHSRARACQVRNVCHLLWRGTYCRGPIPYPRLRNQAQAELTKPQTKSQTPG